MIRNVVAERNALGYSGTNAGGNLHIVSSTWRDNVAGIVPNTLDTELLPPAERVDIVGNLVHGNGVDDVPTLEIEWPSYGGGIIAAGTNDVRIERNRVVGNAMHGILVTPNLSDHLWIASRNEVRDNAGLRRPARSYRGPPDTATYRPALVHDPGRAAAADGLQHRRPGRRTASGLWGAAARRGRPSAGGGRARTARRGPGRRRARAGRRRR